MKYKKPLLFLFTYIIISSFCASFDVDNKVFIEENNYINDSITRRVNSSNYNFNSDIPVLYIDTLDGKGIDSKTDYKQANFKFVGNSRYQGDFELTGQIKGRGNTSWNDFAKKSFKIKFDKKTNMYEMGSNKHWVLISNFMDNSHCRNIIASNIANELNVANMDSTWVDVVINNSYYGLMSFSEHIRIDKNRINISSWDDIASSLASSIVKYNPSIEKNNLETYLEEHMDWISNKYFVYNGIKYNVEDYIKLPNPNGGFILESSKEFDEFSKFFSKRNIRVMVNTPEYLSTDSSFFSYVENYINQFEDAIDSPNGYNSLNKSYLDYVDLDSMIGFWLTNEIMSNGDATSKSRYAYKDIDKKMFFGPVWDFDWSSMSRGASKDPRGWKISSITGQEQNFFKYWFSNAYFLIKARETYFKVRDYLLDLSSDNSILDDYYKYIEKSANRDESRWSSARKGWNMNYYIEEERVLKNFFKDRVRFLDEQFLSEETIFNSLSKYSSYPINLNDDFSIYIEKENLVNFDDLNIKMTLDSKTKKYDILVDGYKVGTYEDANITIPYSVFAKNTNHKFVINAIGYDKDNNLTYQDYTYLTYKNINPLPIYKSIFTKTLNKLYELIKEYLNLFIEIFINYKES